VWPKRDLCFLFKNQGGGCFIFKKMRGGEGYGFFAREDRFRFFFVFSLFLKNYPPVNIFSPPIIMAGGSFIWKISTRVIQGNIAIIIAEIVFYNQHQQILYIWYFILQ